MPPLHWITLSGILGLLSIDWVCLGSSSLLRSCLGFLTLSLFRLSFGSMVQAPSSLDHTLVRLMPVSVWTFRLCHGWHVTRPLAAAQQGAQEPPRGGAPVAGAGHGFFGGRGPGHVGGGARRRPKVGGSLQRPCPHHTIVYKLLLIVGMPVRRQGRFSPSPAPLCRGDARSQWLRVTGSPVTGKVLRY